MKIEETKWQLLAEKKLNLVGTSIVVEYVGGLWPYHVHRGMACHGMCERLAEAKTLACELVDEFVQMGMEP